MKKESCNGCDVIEIIRAQIAHNEKVNGGSDNPMIHIINISEQMCHCGNTVSIKDVLGKDTAQILSDG